MAIFPFRMRRNPGADTGWIWASEDLSVTLHSTDAIACVIAHTQYVNISQCSARRSEW